MLTSININLVNIGITQNCLDAKCCSQYTSSVEPFCCRHINKEKCLKKLLIIIDHVIVMFGRSFVIKYISDIMQPCRKLDMLTKTEHRTN